MQIRLVLQPGVLMGSLGVLFLVAVMTTFAVRGPDRISTHPKWTAPEGNPQQGRTVIQRYGCGACHSIPGIPGATARVGPRLEGLVEKSYIAGQLTNTPQNLARWIQNPRAIAPGTAMPDLGVSEKEARDIAAYLYVTTRTD